MLVLSSCAHHSQLVVKSKPENATVSYFNTSSQSYETLGQTPLTLDPKSGKISQKELEQMSVLKVEREGYVTENILIPGDRLGSSEIVLNLKSSHEWINKDHNSISKVADEIARKLQLINRQTTSRNYRQAITLVDELLVKYPKTPVFYDIKGSLHVLSDEKDFARQSYQKSMELRPDNMKTREILESLK
jgi:hypothetical protein